MYNHSYKNGNIHFQIQQRRYIGNKFSLMPWITPLIKKYTRGKSLFDVFAGSGSVSASLIRDFSSFYINDFLFSNYIIYQAFFNSLNVDWNKLNTYCHEFNQIKHRKYDDTYFEHYFGSRYFSNHDAMVIGEIRQRIHIDKNLNQSEKDVLLASLLYSADHIANTVGHYDAYRKRKHIPNQFHFNLIAPVDTMNHHIHLYRKDANQLVRHIHADVAFIDPPYNSRQYSRFYHVLETLTVWDKPKLYGVALKPKPINMSNYCRVDAPTVFKDLITHLNVRYIVVTYNNTYEEANSSSSRNKITHQQILDALNSVGKTKIFNHGYKYFNTGDTHFKHHQESLFITKVRK